MGKPVELSLLISESFELDPANLVNDLNNGVKVFSFDTPLNHTSRKTYNGNLFTRQYLETGINSDRFQRRIGNNNMVGEFQHPTRDNPERYVQVYDNFVSHRVNDVWFDGELLMGNIQTVTYSKGPHMAKKIAEGTVPAFSLRAVGKIQRDGVGNKKKYLEIITWDNVFDASERAAWADTSTMTLKSPHTNEEGNNVAKSLFMEANVDDVVGSFKSIDKDLDMIAESLGGARPEKIMYSKENNVIGYYSENVQAYRNVKEDLSNDLNDFLRL
jgi:hypothetical protein